MISDGHNYNAFIYHYSHSFELLSIIQLCCINNIFVASFASIANYITKMSNCKGCHFIFNEFQRKPMNIDCGHTICGICTNRLIACPRCTKTFIAKQSNINKTILQDLQQNLSKIPQQTFNVIMVGPSAVGKTSVVAALSGQPFSQNLPNTIGIDIRNVKRMLDNKMINFQIWDTAGQQRYMAVNRNHYKNANFILLVCDMGELSVFNNFSLFLEDIENECRKDIGVILLGNKIDMVNRDVQKMDMGLVVDQSLAEEVRSGRIKKYFVSSKLRIGFQKVWQVLDEAVLEYLKKQNNEKDKNLSTVRKQNMVRASNTVTLKRNSQQNQKQYGEDERKGCCVLI